LAGEYITPSKSTTTAKLYNPIALPYQQIMAGDKHSSKSKREKDRDGDKSKKRHKHRDDDGERHGHKRKRKDGDKLHVVDDDLNEDMWVEKNIDMDGERVRLASCVSPSSY
jgi:hypothetical protein